MAIPVALVVAAARNGVIGADGALPWKLPSELLAFRKITMGHPVIMGRKTHEAIGRPLPGRDNIVLTRSRVIEDPRIHSANSLAEAIALARRLAVACAAKEVMVIGGGEVFSQVRGQAERIYFTEVDVSPPGDTYFETLSPASWRRISHTRHPRQEGDSADYVMSVYDRKVVPSSQLLKAS